MRPILIAMGVALLLASAPETGAQDPPKADGPPKRAERPDDGTKVTSLLVTQTANGLPNQPTKERVLQRLLVTENYLRLDDPHGGVIYLLELADGEPKLFECSLDWKQYRKPDRLGELQRSRDRNERQTLERLKGESELDRKAVMEKRFLRPGLKREVEIVRTGEKKILLEREAERVQITENERVIVDVWLDPKAELDIPFFQFYSKLGAFSDEVLVKLEELRGLPLQVEFTVVTATLAYKIDVEATAVKTDQVPLREFRVPLWSKEVVEESVATCPICGSEVEIAAPGGQSRRRDGTKVYFNSRECVAEFNRREYPERFGKPR